MTTPPQLTPELQRICEELAPKYNGTTCSKDKCGFWREGFKAAVAVMGERNKKPVENWKEHWERLNKIENENPQLKNFGDILLIEMLKKDLESLAVKHSILETKCAILRSQLNVATEALRFYTIGWYQKHARINEYGLSEEVWKNNTILSDHGERARTALQKIEGMGEKKGMVGK